MYVKLSCTPSTIKVTYVSSCFPCNYRILTLQSTEEPFMFQNISAALGQAGNIKITDAKIYLFIHFEGKLIVQCYSSRLEHVFAQLYFNFQ